MIYDKPSQVKDVFLKIKSLEQKIRPITIGAGATRPYIYITFDQEAAAQIVPDTLVYLSWRHLSGKRVKGYNVFTKIAQKPKPIWKLALPPSLLTEGVVQARIELVDSKSVAASCTFEINVLSNPNQEETFTESDDYTVFRDAIIDLTKKINETRELWEDTQQTVEDLNSLFDKVNILYDKLLEEQEKTNKKADKALKKAHNAMHKAMDALNQLVWGEV